MPTLPTDVAHAVHQGVEKILQQFDADQESPVALPVQQAVFLARELQRSAAELRVRLKPSFQMFPIIELINLVESSLQTPVQATVKREDEQAFALLNGQNLMFCEDAGRRIKTALNSDERILDHLQKLLAWQARQRLYVARL